MTRFSDDERAAGLRLVHLALAEDLGRAGDRTSAALIPAEQPGRAAFVARTPGVLAGLPAVELVAAAVDPALRFAPRLDDGAPLAPDTVIAELTGPLRSILAAERTALNFLQRLSGIASLTRKYVEAAAGFRAVVLDTRKTTPGWRLLEKYAVRMGGGTNHRLGLHDGILIKDNHIAGLAGDVARAVQWAREHPDNAGLPVEVEVDSLVQLDAALAVRADIVLLDNMTPEQLRIAVQQRDRFAPQTRLEASGGVTLATIREIAATGVDRISVGAITHSAPALDIGLDYRTDAM